MDGRYQLLVFLKHKEVSQKIKISFEDLDLLQQIQEIPFFTSEEHFFNLL